ncbi:hypothetical protein ACIO5Z_35555 [Streptomyces rochei]|uniref:hypothetical protein n=1 Tax=Streptomyces rochei TaxID=1928 RepID=UPI00380CC8D3
MTVWTDFRNQLTTAPPSVTRAGVATDYGARVVLDRRRRAAWAHEWEDISSQWGRAAS